MDPSWVKDPINKRDQIITIMGYYILIAIGYLLHSHESHGP